MSDLTPLDGSQHFRLYKEFLECVVRARDPFESLSQKQQIIAIKHDIPVKYTAIEDAIIASFRLVSELLSTRCAEPIFGQPSETPAETLLQKIAASHAHLEQQLDTPSLEAGAQLKQSILRELDVALALATTNDPKLTRDDAHSQIALEHGSVQPLPNQNKRQL